MANYGEVQKPYNLTFNMWKLIRYAPDILSVINNLTAIQKHNKNDVRKRTDNMQD